MCIRDRHSLTMMLSFYHARQLSLEFIVEKMCHAPAELFRVKNRGYLDEGSFADLAIVDPNKEWQINKSNIESRCGWSPMEGFDLKGKVISTMCNGQWVYRNNKLTGQLAGQRMLFKTQ